MFASLCLLRTCKTSCLQSDHTTGHRKLGTATQQAVGQHVAIGLGVNIFHKNSPSSVVVRAGDAPGAALIWLVAESPLVAMGVDGAKGGSPSAGGCR